MPCADQPVFLAQGRAEVTASTVATSSRPSTFLRLIWGPAPPDSALPPRKQHPAELLKSSRGREESLSGLDSQPAWGWREPGIEWGGQRDCGEGVC